MLILDCGLAVLEPEHDRVLSGWVRQDGSLDAYDPRIRGTLAPLIPAGGCVVDGGAFLGSHTVVYAEQVGRRGHVVAFEPTPKHLDCLRHNTRLLPQVEIVPMALYSEETTLWITPNAVNAGATVVGSADDAGAFEVQAVPLDAFEWPRLDYLKLDVEGLVLRALEGARRVLAQCRPLVVAEVGDNLGLFGDSTEDLIEFMRACGYVLQELPQIGEDSTHQRDVLFVPKERDGRD